MREPWSLAALRAKESFLFLTVDTTQRSVEELVVRYRVEYTPTVFIMQAVTSRLPPCTSQQFKML